MTITCLSPLVLFLSKCWERSLGHLSQLKSSWPSSQLYHSLPCIRYFSAWVIKRRSQSGKNVKFSMDHFENGILELVISFWIYCITVSPQNSQLDGWQVFLHPRLQTNIANIINVTTSLAGVFKHVWCPSCLAELFPSWPAILHFFGGGWEVES